jgi:hypothetical protein
MATATRERVRESVENICLERVGKKWRLTYTGTDDALADMAESLAALPDGMARWHERKRSPGWWVVSDEGMRLLAMVYPRLAREMDSATWRQEPDDDFGASESRHQSDTQTHTSSTFVPSPVVDAFATLYLTHDAPLWLIQSAYRGLAKACHPDLGGDTTMMQRINSAYATASAWAKKSARVSA